MSKVTVVYDKLLEVLPVLFPDKTRVPNSDSLDDNMAQYTRDGWGLRVDAQDFVESEFKDIETGRVFTVILTREIIKTDSQTSQVDTARKAILEDVLTVQKDFFNDDRLGIPESLARVEITGTSSIQELRSGKSNFLFVEVYFNMHIREDL